MIHAKGTSSGETLTGPAIRVSESSDVDMEEVPAQSPEHPAQDVVPLSEVTSEISEVNHLFEPITISGISSAVELDIESHAPIPVR